MAAIDNRSDIVQLIVDGLRAFANAEMTKPSMAVLWAEPEHDHCGLYISTMSSANLSIPAEFEYPNYRITDIFTHASADDSTELLGSELVEIANIALDSLTERETPLWFGVQVDFSFYKTWEIQPIP